MPTLDVLPVLWWWTVAAAVVWALPWKAWALWRAASKHSLGWFVVLLIVNTVGILEILYVLVISRRDEADAHRWFAAAVLALSVSVALIVGAIAPFWSGVPVTGGCTLEAKLCPDGSAVGRVGPSCEFAPCPRAESPTAPEGVPAFGDYTLGVEPFIGTPTPVDFQATPEAEAFRTVLTRGAVAGPNFAGHYAVVTWGCGTSCQMSAIIDAETGAVVVYGLPSSHGVAYELGSRLFVVNPFESAPTNTLRGEAPVGSDYYLFEDDTLKFIGRFSRSGQEQPICIQVITPAEHPVTGERRDFSTPCDVPFGWRVTGPGVESTK